MTGRDVLKMSTPLIAMGAVWAAQKALSFAYEKATGEPIPKADNLAVPITRVVVYASAAAVVGAVVTAGVNRAIAQAAQPEPDLV